MLFAQLIWDVNPTLKPSNLQQGLTFLVGSKFFNQLHTSGM
jgi:hypothetical protein